MKCYTLISRDQKQESWLMYLPVQKLPQRKRRPELPNVIQSLLGKPPEFRLEMKAKYVPFCCKQCGRYDPDTMFEQGFNDPVRIKIKGDYDHTNDRIFIVSDTFLACIVAAQVRGYESKAVGSSGWHALRITERVDCKSDTIETSGSNCSGCGLPEEAHGGFCNENEICFPNCSNTLFTTKLHWPRPITDRDILMTEEVAIALKAGGIKGGYCDRLRTDAEKTKFWEKSKNGITWTPSGGKVYL